MEHAEKEKAVAIFARLLRRHLRRPLRIGGLFFAALLFGMFCYVFRPFQEVPVEAQSASSGPEVVNGRVESLVVKPVGSHFSSTVAEVRVRPGQKVKKGDLLFTMDSSHLKQDLAMAQAEVESALSAYRLAKSERERDLAAVKAQLAELEAQVAQERALAEQWQQQAQAAYPAEAVEGQVYLTTFDPTAAAHAESQLAQAQAELKQRAQEWDAALAETRAAHSAARKEVARLEGLIASAERLSPIDGVVSQVSATAGQWSEAYQPLVQVDDPSSFRLVTLVEAQGRERFKQARMAPVQLPRGRSEARVEKIEDGWDREAGYFWVWLKPEKTDGLAPGQQVSVALPEPAAEMLEN